MTCDFTAKDDKTSAFSVHAINAVFMNGPPPQTTHTGAIGSLRNELVGENRPNPRLTYRFLTPFDVHPAHVDCVWSTSNNRLSTTATKREKYISRKQLNTIHNANKPNMNQAQLALAAY